MRRICELDRASGDTLRMGLYRGIAIRFCRRRIGSLRPMWESLGSWHVGDHQEKILVHDACIYA